jgi:hypothetical protein
LLLCSIEFAHSQPFQNLKGVGKTATIFACAAELGYEVIELNTSECRSGKQVLALLKEATESHQMGLQANPTPAAAPVVVPAKLAPLFFGGAKPPPPVQLKPPPSMPPPPIPISAPLVQRKRRQNVTRVDEQHGSHSASDSDDSNGDDDDDDFKPVKPSAHKRACSARQKSKAMECDDIPAGAGLHIMATEESHWGSDDSSAEAINDVELIGHTKRPDASITLVAASFVLVEDIDVVLAEDKGFWQALGKLLQTTKKPFIFTSNGLCGKG